VSHRDKRIRAWIGVLALLAMIAVVGGRFASSGSAVSRHYGTWAPGIAGRLTAAEEVPVSQPAPALGSFVARVATDSGGNSSTALGSLRRLIGGAGAGRSVYAFSPGEGAWCVMLEGGAAACPTSPTNPTPGLLWLLDGGYSSNVIGRPSSSSPTLLGLASDRITGLVVVENGERKTVEIKNGAFAVPLTTPTSDRTWALSVDAAYDDGQHVLIDIGDPRN